MALTEPVAGLIGGAIGAGTSLVNNLFANKNIQAQNKANMELANYTYTKDLEMWNKANTYNSPTEQMKRLREAGLNPNLVYGSGANAQSSAQIPKFQKPEISKNYLPPLDFMQVLNSYQDFRMKQAQTAAAEAQAKWAPDLKQAQAWNAQQDSVMKTILAGMMGNSYDLNINKKPTPWQEYQLSNMELGNEKRRQELRNMISQRGKLEMDTQYRQKELDNFLTNMWSKIIYGGAGAVSKFK